MNLYAYVGNDPVNFTDPLGLAICPNGEECDEIVVTATRSQREFRDTLGFWASFGNALGSLNDRGGLQVTLFGGDGAGDGEDENDEGHDYRTKNKVCDRPLTTAEQKDLLSRFAVPSIFSGGPIENGRYLVTNSYGIPGGVVRTTFSADGLSVVNTTTPVHAFVGRIERRFEISNGVTYITTHGYGNAGDNRIGRFRDDQNQKNGPGIFDKIDARAARYARRHYEGC